ncbi:hypothetical protein FVEG_14998 [Fusarium verticillioides 7600]|uniref:Uncharacterized protein n=1 Tax=Gibberella moniliformis (strain M3125 / FGSC 7600) TaxID=334819 RepID=W7LUY8_GIBM7|nr:hypothetical protein FVEG_14998 [Fusarium verticillioides 7600]XP_018745506.1 hypothetical protein FVEG_14998 [Fusarium verticillioides 7600]XP_018745507.1 hypothetical protein FVEG_14998 [Fusarium verticillioides 7600]EWG39314.1 hypothetical protein FVEG_14998 [Fusarium verticillioides 7600]EWG39315.1 hypothetical protein FVEG_14998 [Fusarium verticillioides 7600]EWG39316.1 hypothetical protein FVEG_14998 [Fusarium verticillioides 7600]
MTCSRQTYHRVCLRRDLHSSSISQVTHPRGREPIARQGKVPSGASSRQASPRCEPHPSFTVVGILVRRSWTGASNREGGVADDQKMQYGYKASYLVTAGRH